MTMDIETVLYAYKHALISAKIVFTEQKILWANRWDACGFVYIYIGVDGRSKLSKVLKNSGLWEKDYRPGRLMLSAHVPEGEYVQEITMKENACKAYCETFNEITGLSSYMSSRLD